MKFVQKLGKALMLPVACLPICGILMGLGYAMCPSTMQGGDVTGIARAPCRVVTSAEQLRSLDFSL